MTDSMQATLRRSAYGSEPRPPGPWPLEPLSNGKRLTITNRVLSLDGYDGFNEGEPDILHFTGINYIYEISWFCFRHMSLLHKTQRWVEGNMPPRSFIVGFYLDETLKRWSERQFYVVDEDTIMYTDYYYFYMLRRAEA